MINSNESTVLFWGLIIAAGVLNIVYIVVISRYNRKTKEMEDLKPYIKHLEGMIKEYEMTTKRQNKLLEHGNSNSI